MFLIDYPFASELLMQTSEQINIPMIQTESARNLIGTTQRVLTVEEKETLEKLANERNQRFIVIQRIVSLGFRKI